LTWVRDDCIENDNFRSGLIEDNLFDGCYAFISSRDGAYRDDPTRNQEVVTLRNNLIRIAQQPEPFGHDVDVNGGDKITGSGAIFKYWSNSPSLVLENNIFLIESISGLTRYGLSNWQHHAKELLGFRAEYGQLKECKNNVIVWLGDGPYPGNIPNDPNCITVTTDKSVWNDARVNWIASHPSVPRLPLDPMSVELQADGFTPQIVQLAETEPTDPLPLKIDRVSATVTSDTSVQVEFFMDPAATGQTDYGPTQTLGSVHGPETDLLTYHRQSISGLEPGTTYWFKVSGCTVADLCDESDLLSFTTSGGVSLPPEPSPEHYHPELLQAIEDLAARLTVIEATSVEGRLDALEAAIEAERDARRAAGAALAQ
jgi:hypothetical protein